jgi:hypothetical protein
MITPAISSRCLWCHQAIADAPHGLDQRIKASDVELFSQVADVDVNDIVARVESVLPDLVKYSGP